MSTALAQPNWSDQWFAAHPPSPPPERQLARAQAQPVEFHSATRYAGIGSNQPNAALLLQESIGWADMCARAIANRLASLDLEVVRRRVVRGKSEDAVEDAHPLMQLLDSPSPVHSKRAMLRLIGQHLLTVGDAQLLKIRGPGLEVGELQVMLPSRVRPIAVGGRVVAFEVQDGHGKVTPIPADDVVRIWWADPETLLTGEGVLGPQASAADSVKFASETVRSRFQNNAIPDVVLLAGENSTAFTASEREEFNAQWRDNYHKLSGAARGLPAMLPLGWTAEVLESKTAAEMVAILGFFKTQMLMAYGVPASILGEVVDVNRAAAETNQYVFDLYTVTPIADAISDALTSQLARPMYGPDIRVRFKPFVASDKDYELRREAHDLDQKIRTVNEVRLERGATESKWGDLPVGTFADAPYTGDEPEPIGEDDPAALADDEDPVRDAPRNPRAREATGGAAHVLSRAASPVVLEWQRVLARERSFVPRFRDQYRAVLRAQERAVLEALTAIGLERAAREPTVSAIVAAIRKTIEAARWAKLFELRTERVRKASTQSSGADAMKSVGSKDAFIFTERVKVSLDKQAKEFREQVSRTTVSRATSRVIAAMKESVAAGESLSERTKRIREAVGQGFEVRRNEAKTIARTEMLKATQRAQVEGYAQSGVVERKQWNTSRDDAVRDSHEIDGQQVGLDEDFTLTNGEQGSEPGAVTFSAESVINCRCFMTPVIEEVEP
jgi:phage portal protein BeeE